jgi:hypothetical protein
MVVTAAGVTVWGFASPASAAGSTVTGTVFQDINANGVQDAAGSNTAAEPGVPGVTVTATNSSGASASGVTNSLGVYTFSASGTENPTAPLRLTVTPPTGYSDTFATSTGTGSNSTVRFITVGTPTVTTNFGLTRPGDYNNQANPLVVMPSQRGPFLVSPGHTTDATFNALPALYGWNFSSGGRPITGLTTLATQGQIGTTWGTANYGTNYAFTAAMLKRFTPLGPGGLGAIYLTNVSTATGGTPNATIFTNINAGADPRITTPVDWFHDPQTFAGIYKTGLGDMVVSPDQKTLYVVNLFDQSIYAIPLIPGPTSTSPPTAGTPTVIPLPRNLPGATQACGSPNVPGNVYGFGLGESHGSMYVTLTCTGPAAGNLRGYVYSMTEDSSHAFSSSPVLEFPIGGSRGYLYQGPPAVPATWGPWTDTFTGTDVPSPLLADLSFDATGNVSVSIKDRTADQMTGGGGSTNTADGTTYSNYSGADVLKACLVGAVYTLETNGACGGNTGQLAGTNLGPGGGLFYRSTFADSGPTNYVHEHTLLGGALQVPGFAFQAQASFDQQPTGTSSLAGSQNGFSQEGVRIANITTGAVANWGMTDAAAALTANTSTNNGTFAKSGGLGDLAALIAVAPVEIGNRVWMDNNSNGIQDAGESGISGVSVGLFDASGTTLIATAVTDANGIYNFTSAAQGGANNTSDVLVSSLAANTQYVVKLNTAANFATGGPLVAKIPTLATQGSNITIDNNGVQIPQSTAGFAQTTATTPAVGAADHSYDFGFTTPLSLGNRLWLDTGGGTPANANNGVFNPGEQPVPAGAIIDLLDSSGNPVLSGSVPVTTTTDPQGYYRFDNLLPGTYQIRVDASNFGPTGSLAGLSIVHADRCSLPHRRRE